MKGIYGYKDIRTNQYVYIGLDSHIDKKQRHKQHLQKSHYNRQPFNCILQNNKERYKYIEIEKGIFSKRKILEGLEQAFIMKHNTYNDNSKFNYTKGGEDIGNRFGKNNPFYGKHHSKETRMKMSKNHADVSGPNNPNYGKHHSLKTRQKISQANKGKNNHNYGKKLPQSTRDKISISNSKVQNQSGYYRVSKQKRKDCKDNTLYRYIYKENGKSKTISSVDIKKLEKKVKEKGLKWIVLK